MSSRSHGRAPALAITASCTCVAGQRRDAERQRGRGLEHARRDRRGRVAAPHRQRLADAVHRDVVLHVQLEIAGAAEHEERRACPACRARRASHCRSPPCARPGTDVPPFRGDQVVVHGALARVVDQVVDHPALHAALEQRIALVVVRVQVADDQDVGALSWISEPLECSPLACVELARPSAMMLLLKVMRCEVPSRHSSGVSPREARARRRQVLVGRPGQRAVVDDHVVRADGDDRVEVAAAHASPCRRRRGARGCAG